MRSLGLLAAALVAVSCGGGGTAPLAPPADAGAEGAPGDDAACAPGSAMTGAASACAKGAWSACGADFSEAPSGWGCRDQIPATCTGATREAVGSAACVPVGDCDAPFPPAGAIVVDASTAVVDATHKRTWASAIAAAAPGATIAIESGVYAEAVTTTRDVSIVGRCPEKVSLRGGVVVAQGIRVASGRTLVRGVTLRDHPTVAVSVAPGASLVLEDAVVEDNGMVGVSLSDGGATAKVARSVIRGTRESSSSGESGWGVNAQSGATLELFDVSLSGNHSSGVRLSSDAKGTLDRVVVRGTRRNTAHDFGRGVTVIRGAKATLSRSVVFDNAEIGIVVGDGGELDMTDVVIRDGVPADDGRFGRALNAFGAARVEGTRVWMHDNRDASVMVAEPGTRITLRASSISDTRLDTTGHVGRGITVQEGATLDLFDVAIAGSHEVGLAVFGKGTHARAERTAIVSTKPNLGPAFGNGVMVTDDGLATLQDVDIAGNYGVGVAVGPASAILSLARVRANAVGLYVQDGTMLREVDAIGGAAPTGREVIVTADSALGGNGTRFTAGVVPLPEPLLAK